MNSQPERCRELWRAVLLRTVKDALSSESHRRRPALAWLFRESFRTDRERVLGLVGIDPDAWLEHVRAALSPRAKELADSRQIYAAFESVIKRQGDDRLYP